MRELLDSRCLCGLLAMLLIPYAVAAALYRDYIAAMYQDVDDVLGPSSVLLFESWTRYVLLIAILVLGLGTQRAVFNRSAAPGTIRAIQFSMAAILVGSIFGMYAVTHPVIGTLSKIR